MYQSLLLHRRHKEHCFHFLCHPRLLVLDIVEELPLVDEISCFANILSRCFYRAKSPVVNRQCDTNGHYRVSGILEVSTFSSALKTAVQMRDSFEFIIQFA